MDSASPFGSKSLVTHGHAAHGFSWGSHETGAGLPSVHEASVINVYPMNLSMSVEDSPILVCSATSMKAAPELPLGQPTSFGSVEMLEPSYGLSEQIVPMIDVTTATGHTPPKSGFPQHPLLYDQNLPGAAAPPVLLGQPTLRGLGVGLESFESSADFAEDVLGFAGPGTDMIPANTEATTNLNHGTQTCRRWPPTKSAELRSRLGLKPDVDLIEIYSHARKAALSTKPKPAGGKKKVLRMTCSNCALVAVSKGVTHSGEFRSVALRVALAAMLVDREAEA